MGNDGKIQVAYQACVECGSCRVGCPYKNIGWQLPRGGYGVAYKFG
ncbi:MAG: ferredoxin family protein [Anaerolineae bacterium]